MNLDIYKMVTMSWNIFAPQNFKLKCICPSGTKYASKVVDIDPPTKLSDLDENQEIKIGIRLANEDRFNSENYPMCYWYDTASKSNACLDLIRHVF